jgi:chromosome partitioning protein
MSRKLVIANFKGGVGKTTTTVNLGAALAEAGYRVLLIDLDPQAGMTTALGLDPRQPRASVAALLGRSRVALSTVAVDIESTLLLLPAALELAALEARFGTHRGAAARLRKALADQVNAFDFVLMDTPPGLNVLTVNGLVAADEVIVPVQAQYLAMFGVRTMLDTLRNIQSELNPALSLAGILATMVRPDSIHAREVVAELRAVFPAETFRTVIPVSAALQDAPVAGSSVLACAPQDSAAVAYRAFAEEIIAHESTPQ